MEWLIELGKGIGKFFLNPLLYLGLVYSVYLGYIRVKRERKNFNIRVQDGWFEFRTYLKKGWLPGLIVTAVLLLIGVLIPFEFVLVFSITTLVLALILQPSVLSVAYTGGLTFCLLIAIYFVPMEIPFITNIFQDGYRSFIPSLAFVMNLLLLAEGFLIYQNGGRNTSPKLTASKRGLTVGIHESKRLWMVPLLLLIPADALSLPLDFWPAVPINHEPFTFLLLPYWIGFSTNIRSVHPEQGVRKIGRNVMILGAIVTLISLVGFWFPFISIVAVGSAILGRVAVALMHYVKDDAQIFYFSKMQEGIVILDIIPDSPADKMCLKVGEII